MFSTVVGAERGTFRELGRSGGATTTGESGGGFLETRGLAPLGVGVARFLGLAKTDSPSPPLVEHVLPSGAPAFVKSYMASWLLSPPAESERIHFANLVECFSTTTTPLSKKILKPVSFGKLADLPLTASKGSAEAEFEAIKGSLEAFSELVENVPESVPALQGLARFDSGLDMTVADVQESAKFLGKILASVLKTGTKVSPSFSQSDRERGPTSSSVSEEGPGLSSETEELDHAFLDSEEGPRKAVDRYFWVHGKALRKHNLRVDSSALETARHALLEYVGNCQKATSAKVVYPMRTRTAVMSASGAGCVSVDPRGREAGGLGETTEAQDEEDADVFHDPGLFFRLSDAKKDKLETQVIIQTTWGRADKKGRYKPKHLQKLEQDFLVEKTKLETHVQQIIAAVCAAVQDELQALLFLNHALIVASVTLLHAEESLRRGWVAGRFYSKAGHGGGGGPGAGPPAVEQRGAGTTPLSLPGLRPYWIPADGVTNDVTFNTVML